MLGVAGLVTNASGVLEQVQRRLHCGSARAAVEWSRCTLDQIRQDLEQLSHRTNNMTERSSWVLNPRWHPVVFQVASSRDTVLLTVALNAVRVVSQTCYRILDDRWPGEVEDRLAAQRKRLAEVEEELLEARARSGAGEDGGRGGT